ncbi:hypothetical protein ABPG72_019233 [Tetrahymena utriculariae]
MKPNEKKRNKNTYEMINNLSLSFKDQSTEENFCSQKISNKLRITLIDQIWMSLVYGLQAVVLLVHKKNQFAIIYFCATVYLNVISFLGRKFTKYLQVTILVHLIAQMIVFTELIIPFMKDLDPTSVNMATIVVYVRHSYFLSIMDSWCFRFFSLLLLMYYPIRNINFYDYEYQIGFVLFFLQMLFIYYFDNKSERIWFINQCSIKEDLQFWKTLFKKNLQSVVFVISIQKYNEVKVEFCNDQGLKDFRAKSKSDFELKILNDFHINLFENRQYQLFKDFIYSKYNRQQSLSPSPKIETGSQKVIKNQVKSNHLINNVPNEILEGMENKKNNSNIAGEQQQEFRLDEHIYMNSFYIDPKTSNKLYYDVKLVNCYWKNQFAIMAFLTNVPQNNLVNRLQKINQYKDELLATVSHDLKTPLNAMIQVVQTAMSQCKNEEYNNYFDIIDKNGKLLLNIINDILDYSQIMKGKLRLTHQIFSIKQVIQEVHELLKYQFQDKGIDFLIDIEQDIQVQNDQNRLKQILNNIIGNALKFTFKGYVKVQVISLPENQSVQISVEDSGTGIEASLQPKLFQLYSTFDHNKGSSKHGVGLGLAICKKLVQLMGPQDTIQLISEKGKGSKFIFEIYQSLDIQRANQKTKSALLESRRSLDNSSLIYSPEYKKQNTLHLFHQSASIINNNSNNQDLIQSFLLNQQQQQLPILTLQQQQQSISKLNSAIQAQQNSSYSNINSNTNFTSVKSHNLIAPTINNSQFTNIFGISAPSLTGYFPTSHRQNILNGIIENNEEGNNIESDQCLPFTKKINQKDKNNNSGQQQAVNSNISRTPAHNRFAQDNMNAKFKILSYNDIEDEQSQSIEGQQQQQQQQQQQKIRQLSLSKSQKSEKNIQSRKEINSQVLKSSTRIEFATPKKKKDKKQKDQYLPKSLANIEENDVSPHFPSTNQNSLVESQDLIEFKRDDDFNDLRGHIQNNYTFIEQKKFHILENYLKNKLKRILIVDDTPFNIRALKIVLDNIISSSQVEILQAFNGQQSLEVLSSCLEQEKQIDLIFMDINMPVMDGYEATKKIREIKNFDNTKIIFATAYSEYSDLCKQSKTGGDGYLQKPIHRQDVLRILKDLSLQSFNSNNQQI